MHKMRSFIRNTFSAENSEKFRQEKFRHNHLCIFALSVYLTFEQLYYGFCISEPGSLRQKIFIGTAGLMLAYTAISALIHAKKTGQLTRGHKIYELSFGLSGFAIAIARSLILQNHTFALPSIYIAVIYGFAVFFICRRWSASEYTSLPVPRCSSCCRCFTPRSSSSLMSRTL